MKIYTRTGDDGTTSLRGGSRVPKTHPRVEAYGTVDELISWIGLLRDHPVNSERKEILIYIQSQLMFCAAVVASGPGRTDTGDLLPEEDCATILEKEIDKMEMTLKPLDGFILPGGDIIVSYCHIARCVCRRTERALLRVNQTEKIPGIIIKFINRLADYLFVLGRKICLELDIEEVRWKV